MIILEFFGIPRERAGVARATLEASPRTLAELWPLVGEQFPAFGQECLDSQGRMLQRHLTVNIDGQRFADDPATPLAEGACVLILSADAGG
jgi:molybdopterin converting factor small subunit